MHVGRTLFSQVMDFVPWTSFDRIVGKYGGDVRVRVLRCTEHFRAMAFAQVTYRESLRDIEACLGAQPSKLYGMGLRAPIAKSTLADANELRDWHIWSDLAAVLIKRARKLYLQDDIGLDLANTVYALDSTTIDLCLSLFPWADFRSTKAAVKMHTLLDLRGPIPSFIHISNGKMGDAVALDLITLEAGAIYVMDRGYVDFRRLYVIHQAGAFFVTRTKSNMNYHRVYSRAVDKTTGVGSDQSIVLDGFYTCWRLRRSAQKWRNAWGRQKGPRWWGPCVLWKVVRRSERRVADIFVVTVGGDRLELIAILVLDLERVALPDRLSQVVDQLEDSEGLLGRPVGRDLESDGERQACGGFGHDLALRRFWARCSDRSWASLRR